MAKESAIEDYSRRFEEKNALFNDTHNATVNSISLLKCIFPYNRSSVVWANPKDLIIISDKY